MVKRSWLTSVTQFTSTPVEGDVGQLRWEGNKCYRYVYNAHTAALANGNAVITGTASTDEGTVARMGTAGYVPASAFGGIAVSAIPTLNYGWVQVSGRHEAVNVDAATAILLGDALLTLTGTFNMGKATTGATTSPPGGHVVALAALGSGTGTIAGKINGVI